MGSRRADRWQPPEPATAYSLSAEAIEGPTVGAGLAPVRAWVQTPEGLFRVDAFAVSMTPVAVLVRWQDGSRTLEAWVWRRAVKNRAVTHKQGPASTLDQR